MASTQYNHTAWWVGGLIIVALIVVAFYMVYSSSLGRNTAATDTASISEQSVSKGVGSTAPAQVTSSTDITVAESALDDSDPDAMTAELNQNELDLANF